MKKLFLINLLILYPIIGCAGWYHQDDSAYQLNLFWQEVHRRQRQQDYRIDRAIQVGLLTTPEIRKLRHQQNRLAKQIDRYKRHHFLDLDDKQCILDRLNHLSREIRRMTGNNRYHYSYHAPIISSQVQPYIYRQRPIHLHSIGFYFRF